MTDPTLASRGTRHRGIARLGRIVAILGALCVPAPGRPTTWYVDASAAEGGNGRSWETAFRAIRAALNHAWGTDTIIVAQGRYVENVQLLYEQNIILRSTDPLSPTVVANTVIDGGGQGPTIAFDGDEGATCVIEGFTITNGAAWDGGGINGNGTLATIRNNVITGNLAHGADELRIQEPGSEADGSGAKRGGGGIYWCNGVIEDNIVSDNVAGSGVPLTTVGWGGGLCRCHGTLRNNTIIRNKALGQAVVFRPPYAYYYYDAGGGALSHCNGIIEDNYIADNISEYDGGGLHSCDGLIQRNIIARNVAEWGGGVTSCGGCIRNNLVVSNSAVKGGGLLSGSPSFSNNTIVGNRAANEGGGLHSSSDAILSCIVWANTAPHGAQLIYSSLPGYSCIEDWTGGGEGNINLDPAFMDPGKGDFRLRADSPCIDAGFNDPDLPESDIVGMHRVMFGGKSLTVDMGAYEFYINKVEPVFGTNETIFTWSSLADKTYSIFYTDDLFNWHLAIEDFPSSGNQTTSWLDDGSFTGLPPLLAPKRFYGCGHI